MTISRREFVSSSAALTAATVAGCAPAFAGTDPVVALWDELEAARAVLKEKVIISDALSESVPAPFKCARHDLRVSIPSKTFVEQADGTLAHRETRTARVDREWLEQALERPASAEFRVRQRAAMARLEKLEAEWNAAHEESHRAELEVESAFEACDAIEDRIVAAEASSPEGIIYKIRLGLRRNDIHRDYRFTLEPFTSAMRDIERISV